MAYVGGLKRQRSLKLRKSFGLFLFNFNRTAPPFILSANGFGSFAERWQPLNYLYPRTRQSATGHLLQVSGGKLPAFACSGGCTAAYVLLTKSISHGPRVMRGTL